MDSDAAVLEARDVIKGVKLRMQFSTGEWEEVKKIINAARVFNHKFAINDGGRRSGRDWFDIEVYW